MIDDELLKSYVAALSTLKSMNMGCPESLASIATTHCGLEVSTADTVQFAINLEGDRLKRINVRLLGEDEVATVLYQPSKSNF